MECWAEEMNDNWYDKTNRLMLICIKSQWFIPTDAVKLGGYLIRLE